MKKITYEVWVDQYKPLNNPDTIEGSYENKFFQIKEHLFKDDKYIWTLVSGENENMWIIPGFHYVNREGYFLTEIPWESEDIEVNDNEMLTIGDAKYMCKDFIEDILDITLTDAQEDLLHNYFVL
jgi:hypothetical protein